MVIPRYDVSWYDHGVLWFFGIWKVSCSCKNMSSWTTSETEIRCSLRLSLEISNMYVQINQTSNFKLYPLQLGTQTLNQNKFDHCHHHHTQRHLPSQQTKCISSAKVSVGVQLVLGINMQISLPKLIQSNTSYISWRRRLAVNSFRKLA